MDNHGNFTAKDIERYHRGGMTAAEMHQLEKAALDDPMLADALEGYALTTTPSDDLQLLQSRLEQRIQQKETKVIPLIQQQWFRIAALLILVAGAGWLVFQTVSTNETNRASNQTNSNTESSSTTLDSASLTTQPPPPALTTDSVTPATDLAAAGTETKPTVTNATSAAPPARKKKTDPGTQPSLEESQALMETVAAAPTAGKANPNAGQPVDVGRMADSAAASDMAAKQNSAEAPEVRSRAMSQARAKTSQAIPENGWQAWEDYLVKNKKPASVLQIGSVKGEVVLDFETDEKGEPKNIIVSKSLCPKCDEEAIRLLKEGPRWTPLHYGGKATIRFR